jgi:hypothetical protein
MVLDQLHQRSQSPILSTSSTVAAFIPSEIPVFKHSQPFSIHFVLMRHCCPHFLFKEIRGKEKVDSTKKLPSNVHQFKLQAHLGGQKSAWMFARPPGDHDIFHSGHDGPPL